MLVDNLGLEKDGLGKQNNPQIWIFTTTENTMRSSTLGLIRHEGQGPSMNTAENEKTKRVLNHSKKAIGGIPEHKRK